MSFYRGVVEPSLFFLAGIGVAMGIIVTGLDPQMVGLFCFCTGVFTGYGIVWSMMR